MSENNTHPTDTDFDKSEASWQQFLNTADEPAVFTLPRTNIMVRYRPLSLMDMVALGEIPETVLSDITDLMDRQMQEGRKAEDNMNDLPQLVELGKNLMKILVISPGALKGDEGLDKLADKRPNALVAFANHVVTTSMATFPDQGTQVS